MSSLRWSAPAVPAASTSTSSCAPPGSRSSAAAAGSASAGPSEAGGRGASIEDQVAFHEEYAKAGGPARIGHIGEQLVAPTLIAFGTQEQKDRFLPGIKAGTELWCQGYSEPGAGSDLAAVRTKAVLEDDGWHVTGQKVWTSLAHLADWCFVIARTNDAPQPPRPVVPAGADGPARHRGPPDRPAHRHVGVQRGLLRRRARRVDWSATRATAGGSRWDCSPSSAASPPSASRSASTASTTRCSRWPASNGSFERWQDELIDAWAGLQVLRHQALRTLSSDASASTGVEANVNKLLWAPWHRQLGELAMRVAGPAALEVGPDGLSPLQNLFLFTRSDTIYGGSNEIQRNVIAERHWKLPRDTFS